MLPRLNATYSFSAVSWACCQFSWSRGLGLLKQLKISLSLNQLFSIHFEARTSSGRKNHFCTPCTIWCIVFCIIREVRTETFAPQEVPSRTPWVCEHPQFTTTALNVDTTCTISLNSRPRLLGIYESKRLIVNFPACVLLETHRLHDL